MFLYFPNINKRLLLILVSLMICLTSFSIVTCLLGHTRLFYGNAKSEPKQFTTYKSAQDNFSFDYPSDYQLEVHNFHGGEILHHISFREKETASHGFFQVWILEDDLESFLEKSIADSQNSYKYFDIKKKELSGDEGIFWDYSVAVGSGFFKASEFFIKRNSNMYRLSYFVPEENWDEKYNEIFEHMQKSIIIKE